MKNNSFSKAYRMILPILALAVLIMAVYAGIDRQMATGVGYWMFLHYESKSREFWEICINIGMALFVILVSVPGLFVSKSNDRLLSISRFIIFVFALSPQIDPAFFINLFYKASAVIPSDTIPDRIHSLVILCVMILPIILLLSRIPDIGGSSYRMLLMSASVWTIFTMLCEFIPGGYSLWIFLSVYFPAMMLFILYEKVYMLVKDRKIPYIFMAVEILCFLRCAHSLLAITASYNI